MKRWIQAPAICAASPYSGVLATIRDDVDNAAVASLLSGKGPAWLGARYSNGAWRWSDVTVRPTERSGFRVFYPKGWPCCPGVYSLSRRTPGD